MPKKVGILTGGGDCPGLNAVIRAVVRKATLTYGYEVIGILEGWRGLLNGLIEPLTVLNVSGILNRGGTILRTSRTNPLKRENGIQTMKERMKLFDLYALVAIGGDDTMSVAQVLDQQGVNVVGIPKTIDNDLPGTDFCFGFDTAVNIAMEAIDRVHTTAEAHNRVMIVEVMGRDAGWIALYSGLAGGADVILVPERPVRVSAVCELLKKRHARGKDFSIVVAAEGARLLDEAGQEKTIIQSDRLDEFGHVRLGGISTVLAREIEERTGFETRVVVLGHIQRGGSPTAFDRVLATRFGIAAIDLVHRGEFGRMVAMRGNQITAVPFSDATSGVRHVEPELYDIASVFFG